MFRHKSATPVLPIVACIYTLYGIIMLVQPAARTSSAAYSQAFNLFARQVWAVAFIVAGLAVLITFAKLAAFLLAFLVALWALLLGLSAVHTPTLSLTGIVTNGGLAVLLLVSLGWAGVRDAP